MSAHPIKIMFAINTLARGGSERQLVELVTGLDRARFTTSVACVVDSGPLADEFTAVGIAVSVFDVRRALELVRFIRHTGKIAPDIVHSFLFGSNIAGALAATIARVPIVITSRRSLGFFKDGRPHYDMLQRLANHFTDAVVANAEAVRSDTIRREHLDPRKIQVIYNGVNLDRFTATAEPTAVRHAMLRDRVGGPLVVAVSNLIPYKGLEFFVDAWRDVVRQMPNATAIVVGEGPARADLEARSADIAESIHFIGTREDVPSILAEADLLVHASLYEGFPNAVLEAMAASRPVVATSVGGTVEAVEHERTGIVVPPRDSSALAAAILRLLRDGGLAREYGRAGRARVESEFSRSRMIERYARLYMSLARVP